MELPFDFRAGGNDQESFYGRETGLAYGLAALVCEFQERLLDLWRCVDLDELAARLAFADIGRFGGCSCSHGYSVSDGPKVWGRAGESARARYF